MDVTAPQDLAYDSRDGSVGIADLSPSSTYLLSEYVVSGDYTLGPTSRQIAPPGNSVGDNWVVDVPLSSLTAGTYAAALTNGTETDSSAGLTAGQPPG